MIGQMGIPTVIVQEGGYDLETLGDLVAGFLDGFQRG
jgi:acetoin utilization deacetylase AcuC-like enzyme